jgi:hypothetical protein
MPFTTGFIIVRPIHPSTCSDAMNLPRNSPTVPAIACAFLALLPSVLHGADLVQPGKIIINPTVQNDPVSLQLLGRAADDANVEAPGMALFYHDAGADAASTVLRIFRPNGQYQWQLSTNNGGPRLAMHLADDHTLALFNPADGSPSIVFQPGGVASILINGQPLSVAGAGATALPGEVVFGNYNLQPGANGTPTDPIFVIGNGASAQARSNAMQIGGNGDALFFRSLSAGHLSRAHGEESVAFGYDSHAYGTNSAAMGWHCFANGNGAFTAGTNNNANGTSSVAMGGWNTARWSGDTVFGAASVAEGSPSFSAGLYNLANGFTSVALSYGSTALGTASLATGTSVAQGHYSASFGLMTKAQGYAQLACGRYNLPLGDYWQVTADEPLFVVGNGTAGPDVDGEGNAIEHRSNAFVVRNNGEAAVQGALVVEGGSAAAPVTSVFARDIDVQGVLRVRPAGDIGMGAFIEGRQP